LAAEKEHKIAKCNLGIYYQNGDGVEKYEIKAFECFKRSAEKEYVEAQFQLGYCYSNGIGTKVNKVKHSSYIK